MKQIVLLMVGPPGSGKTTAANNIIKELPKWISVRYISRDIIRQHLLGVNDEYFSKEKEVFAEFATAAIRSITEGTRVTILDATHINEVSRAKILRRLPLDNVTVIPIVVLPPLQTCIERNDRRKGFANVPTTVIRNMYDNFAYPTEEEKFINGPVLEVNDDGKLGKEDMDLLRSAFWA